MKQTDADLVAQCLQDLESKRLAAQQSLWADVVRAARQEAPREQALRQRAMQGVVRRIAELPDPSDLDQGVVRSAWRGLGAAAAACAALLVLLGGWVLLAEPARDPASANGAAPTLTAYVAFGAQSPGDGTAANPFTQVELGIEALQAGGVVRITEGTSPERIRITKPTRLEALDGTVRIGAAASAAE